MAAQLKKFFAVAMLAKTVTCCCAAGGLKKGF
jgi:hypothetical protein